ncbi:hypothetical protein BDW62DRAFT_186349 [Aspergillus aurantiobrunneus]
MFTKIVVSVSLAAGICVPFYVPYARSRSVSPGKGYGVGRTRKYPAIGPFFHLY